MCLFIACPATKPWSSLLPLSTCKGNDWFSYIMTEHDVAFQKESKKTIILEHSGIELPCKVKLCHQKKLL